MLSICIPIYNVNIESLAFKLNDLCVASGVNFEILIADDCSQSKYDSINKKAAQDIKARYLSLSANIGRSAIRNLLCREARYENLIFLDCDSIICTDQFIENYLPFCNKNSVVYGGRKYHKEAPEFKYKLHWKYGWKRESKSLTVRSFFPTRYFSTNNFFISKNILVEIPFDEKLIGYGHEDTLFAMELFQNDILVVQIDNPVIHGGLERNDVFFKKAEAGIRNLVKIYDTYPNRSVLKSHVSLIEAFMKIERSKLTWLVMLVFLITRPFLKVLIKNSQVLKALDFYKLGLFCYYLDKKSTVVMNDAFLL